MNWLDLLVVQGTLKSLLQHHSSKASVLQHPDFFIVQLSLPYMTTGKTTALTRWTFVDKVMSLLSNMLSRSVTAFLPRSNSCVVYLVLAGRHFTTSTTWEDYLHSFICIISILLSYISFQNNLTCKCSITFLL